MSVETKEFGHFVKSGSMSDAVIHFILMFNKSSKNATFDLLYQANYQKYKSKKNLRDCLRRLLKNNLIRVDSNGNHFLTFMGIEIIQELALERKQKHALAYDKQAYKSKDPNLPGATYDTHFENQYF
jgi:predicted transcriptional regulator